MKAEESGSTKISVVCEDAAASLKSVTVKWRCAFKPGVRFLGDALERGYGDLGWRGVEPDRVMPWYFIAHDGRSSFGAGVKTGAASLCFWQAGGKGFSLKLDTRCGNRGFLPGKRVFEAAELTLRQSDEMPLFAFACEFVSSLSAGAILPSEPVFGFNDWYYAYGRNSEESILRDSALCGELANGLPFKPFSVIDAGWEHSSHSAPWSLSSRNFPDMKKLAARMSALGCKPGLWFRPLVTPERLPETRTLETSRFPRFAGDPKRILDPSVPENLEIVKEDVRRFKSWGFELVKHDFSVWDCFGKWGFEMRDGFTSGDWSFQDKAKTNAQVFSGLYKAIHEASEGMLVIACNAIGHLTAGYAQISRIGDDTSGLEWSRTRKMGVNSLAFRIPQDGSFFMADADCAGIANSVPWRLNAQWIDLLARSGTALFVSAAPDATGPEQKAALRRAFANACRKPSLPEPLDWLDGVCPERWRLDGEIVEFDWSE